MLQCLMKLQNLSEASLFFFLFNLIITDKED